MQLEAIGEGQHKLLHIRAMSKRGELEGDTVQRQVGEISGQWGLE